MPGVGEAGRPAAGEDLPDLEGVAADGGDVLLAVRPALLGGGELREGGQGGGLGRLGPAARAVHPALVGGPAQRGVRADAGAAWAVPGPRSAARSLGVGTPLGAEPRSCAPLRASAACWCSGSGAERSAAAARADSGSGAERIAAISGRGHRRRRAHAAEILRADGPGDPLAVEHPPLVRLGHQVLGLVVVAVRGLHGPQVDGDAVLLGGHHARAADRRRRSPGPRRSRRGCGPVRSVRRASRRPRPSAPSVRRCGSARRAARSPSASPAACGARAAGRGRGRRRTSRCAAAAVRCRTRRARAGPG